MEYIVYHRFKQKALCGNINIPAMQICEEIDGIIYYNNKIICLSKSENAHKYFTRNDDGQGMLRGKFIQLIENSLNKDTEQIQTIWKKILNDPICKKYKRFKDDDDNWIWNHDFYNANINDLKYIANLIGIKIKQ